ncbi:MAG TPA: DUF3795 domain-containing protein [Rhizomicrobium sp.]|nr:DUF3795 domain-containing protein [Rhizomicrobium sp.]
MIELKSKLIAPCGMNCGICKGHLRAKNRCPGCFAIGTREAPTRVRCVIRHWTKRNGRFCCHCPDFPCKRLKQLDIRYRTKYGMSEIENLEFVRDHGIRAFIAHEQRRWVSPEGILCVHDRQRYFAESARPARVNVTRAKRRES